MDFTPLSMSVQQILNSGKHMLIPRFQREYCWDNRVTTEFYQDIVSRINFKGDTIKTSPYFIGTMLFLGTLNDSSISNDGSSDDLPLEIVDGQQRITTITILLSALSARLQPESDVLANKVFNYVLRTDDDGKPFPVLTTKTSYPFFQNYVQTPVNKRDIDFNSPQFEEDESIKSAYDNFSRLLNGDDLKRQIISMNGLDTDALDQFSDLEILVAIRKEILSMQTVVITSKDRASANMIFEILNGKGVRLANIDLIKNRLFERIPDNTASDNAEDLWKEIRTNLDSRQDNLGLATFYRHFWISKYHKVTSAHLYDSFKENVTPATRERYMEFLKEMKIESARYAMIVHPRLDDFKDRQEYQPVVQGMNITTNWFNVNQSRIGFLALLDAKERQVIKLKSLCRCIKAIEVFHFVYNSVCHMPANRFESLYSKFAISLRKSESNDIAQQKLETFRSNLASLLPNQLTFVDNFCNLSFSKDRRNASNMASKYVINVIAAQKSERKYFFDDLSVEHIIPESYSSENVKNIGNLIALETKLNDDAKDLESIQKYRIYQQSKYAWIKEFLEKHDNFLEGDIPQRARSLAEYVYSQIIVPVLME